jgi:hypothetical protein
VLRPTLQLSNTGAVRLVAHTHTTARACLHTTASRPTDQASHLVSTIHHVQLSTIHHVQQRNHAGLTHHPCRIDHCPSKQGKHTKPTAAGIKECPVCLLQATMQLINNACSSCRHPACCTCGSDTCQAGLGIWHALLISLSGLPQHHIRFGATPHHSESSSATHSQTQQ